MNKSVSRAVDILAFLSQCCRPAGITEISRALDIPKSSASDCLYTLLEKGYVRLDDNRQRTFSLGVNTAKLGLAVLDRIGYGKMSEAELDSLHRKTGLTACFYVLSEGGALCSAVKVDEAKRGISTVVGDVLELHLCAAGKAMLSLLSESEVETLVGTGCYSVRTSNSICNYFALNRELELTRSRGYAIENFENNSFTYAIASPLSYLGGKPAAVSIEMSASELDRSDIRKLAFDLCATAERLSEIFNTRFS